MYQMNTICVISASFVERDICNPTKKRQVILTYSRYTTQAKREAEDFEVFEISNVCGYEQLLRQLMEEDGIERVGFEDQHIGYAAYDRWTKQIPGKIWTELGESLNNLRVIKEAWELERLEKAESIGDAAFSHILNVIKPGMTELAIAAEIEYCMKQHGASGTSFDTIVASGIHSAMPHAIPSDKKVEVGDFVTMDFGCKYDGYCSDMTRTIVIGKASDKQKRDLWCCLRGTACGAGCFKSRADRKRSGSGGT